MNSLGERLVANLTMEGSGCHYLYQWSFSVSPKVGYCVSPHVHQPAAHSPTSRCPPTKASRAPPWGLTYIPRNHGGTAKWLTTRKQKHKVTTWVILQDNWPNFCKLMEWNKDSGWIIQDWKRMGRKKDENRVKKHSNQVSYMDLFEKLPIEGTLWRQWGKFAMD